MPTVERFMETMGFPPNEVGPNVVELRKVIAQRISDGSLKWPPRLRVHHKDGRWITFEDQAKAALAQLNRPQNRRSSMTEWVPTPFTPNVTRVMFWLMVAALIAGCAWLII